MRSLRSMDTTRNPSEVTTVSPSHHPGTPPSGRRTDHVESPGPLHGQVWLTVQTLQARRLVRGRSGSSGKPRIPGLMAFADRLRIIWQAARDDDPYADWWLIKIHDAIEAKGKRLQTIRSVLDERLARLEAIEVSIALSERPYRLPLRFTNPYAYRAAQLLATYDGLVCTALTANHVGALAHRAADAFIRQGAGVIRGLFALPQGYRFLRIDRAAMLSNGAQAREAIRSMGVLPEDVSSGDRRAPLAPLRRSHDSAFARHVELSPEDSDAFGRAPENDDT